jgi:hypothetical protein
MAKINTWNEVEAILDAQAKLPKGLREALELILKPKTSGGSTNPSKVIDGITYHYCRFHQEYEVESNMVMSSGKSKGYCKASISIWNKRNSALKKKEAEISELVMLGDFEQARECGEELQTMKTNLNNPSAYDIVSDWSTFSTPRGE